MKILLAQNLIYFPSLNGASKANRHMLEGLAARGITCRVVAQAAAAPGPQAYVAFQQELEKRGLRLTATNAQADIFHSEGVEVHAVREPAQFRAYLMQQIRDFDPSWTIVSSEDPGQTLLEAALKASPARVVYLTHTSQMLPCGPHGFLPSESRTELLRQAAGIIVVSQFLKEYIQRWSGCDSVVISPPVYGSGPFPRHGRFDHGSITMINPCAVKGLPIFLELAQRLPDAPFAAVPTWGTTDADRAALAALPNMRLLKPADDIDEILAQTRILVVPSLWTEAFGLIVVEAMLRGIPVLASNVGGLPEAKLGVEYVLPVRPIERYNERAAGNEVAIPDVPEQDVTLWLDALQALLADRDHYERLATASRDAALSFAASVGVDPLVEFLRNLTPARPRPIKAVETPATETKSVPGLPANLTPQQRALLALRLRKKNEAAAKQTSIPRRPPSDIAPLSFAQQRLWFLDQLEPGNVSYNIPLAVWLSGLLQIAALQQALDGVVRRHEVLRTTFAQDAHGQPVQRIKPDAPVPLAIVDLSPLPVAERETAAREQALNEAHTPFDLIKGPVLRATLLRLDTSEHVLLLTLHHIVADGWSLDLLIQEIVALYTAAAAGLPDPLPELPIQYADFAIWQRQWLQGPILEEQLTYWRQHLLHLPTLQLPTDYSRPAVQSFQGGQYPITIAAPVTTALRALSREANATLFMTVLAAFKALLMRYSDQVDIVVGTPVSNRSRTETERLIGFFINTLVLRTNLDGNPTFRDLLGRVREVAMGAYAHQDLPFEHLVEALQPERDLSRQPLFQVTFALNKAATPAYDRGPLTLQPLEASSETVKFDLTLELLERADTIEGRLEYSTDLFTASTIERMAEHLKLLLQAVAADPNQHLAAVPLLSVADRHDLLRWNDTAIDYPADQRLHDLVAEQAARTPDGVALSDGQHRFTYRELNRQADRLACHLQSLGVGPNVLVGLCMERSLEMIVGLLAILKAGGAYVPLDPTYPQERLQFMLKDTEAAVLLTQARLIERLPEHSAHLICLDPGWEAAIAPQPAVLHHAVTPHNLAYIIYTSGSTGVPKGVAIAHRSAVVLMHWARRIFPPADLAGVLAATSICFDLSVFEIFVPLSWGGTVILAENALHLPTLPNASEVTLINTVPSAIAELIRSNGIPESVRTVNLAGEPLPRRSVEQLYQRKHIERVFNLYGPSEDTTYSTFALIERADRRAPSIGCPVANTQIYLLDHSGQPVPIGVTGEVYIGGEGLAQGYLNRPALTAERFVPDPFSAPGARLYRTGDLARYRANGELEYLGRIDHQIKVRGFRIEMGEIETALSRHPSVREAVVLVRQDIPGDVRIVAYVMEERRNNQQRTVNNEQGSKERKAKSTAPPADNSARFSTLGSELRRFLRASLPEYMVPSAFVLLEALPLTPNGKIDRKRLPAPESGGHDSEQQLAAPRTPIEDLLVGIWASVLGIERVGVHDNFFELGGHSLLATQILARLPAAWKVPLRRIFEAPTVAELAEQIQATLQADAELPPLQPMPRNGDIPLSFAQQRLWFLEQVDAGTAAYNIPLAVRLQGPLNLAVLQRALDGLVQRHESLRTTFPARDGQPVQVIHPSADLPLVEVDLMTLPEARREAEIARIAMQEVSKPFDLQRGPLLRVLLLRLGAEQHVALLIMHHIISDAWSLGVLLRDLAALYTAYTAAELDDEQPALPELPIQYADFAIWQRQLLQGAGLDKLRRYWKEQLAGAPPSLNLPTDYPRPAVQTYNGASHQLSLSEEATAALHRLSRRENVTLFMVLLGTFQIMLHYYTGMDDLVVGTDVANRTRLETEDLVGFFVNQLVLRTDLQGDPTFHELLERVREVCLNAYAHQDLPFQQLVEVLQIKRDLSMNPLFQVSLILQSAPIPSFELRELTFDYIDVAGGSGHFDLLLNLWDGPAGLSGKFDYNADLFSPATIVRMSRHFALLVQQIGETGTKLSALTALLAEHDRQEQTAKEKEFKDLSLQRLKNIRQRSRRDAGEA